MNCIFGSQKYLRSQAYISVRLCVCVRACVCCAGQITFNFCKKVAYSYPPAPQPPFVIPLVLLLPFQLKTNQSQISCTRDIILSYTVPQYTVSYNSIFQCKFVSLYTQTKLTSMTYFLESLWTLVLLYQTGVMKSLHFN